jgi:hypothetical protein
VKPVAARLQSKEATATDSKEDGLRAVLFRLLLGDHVKKDTTRTNSSTGTHGEAVGSISRHVSPLLIESSSSSSSSSSSDIEKRKLDQNGNAEILSDQVCMNTAYRAQGGSQNINCNAKEVVLGNAANITILDDGCASPSDTVTFSARFDVVANADRYDVGIWFAQDGGDAQTGTCTAVTTPYGPSPQFWDLDETVTGQANDTCGDIKQGTIQPFFTLTVKCAGIGGKLKLPYCTSWRQSGDNQPCFSPHLKWEI